MRTSRLSLLLALAIVAGAMISISSSNAQTSATTATSGPCAPRPTLGNSTPALRQWFVACVANMSEFRQEAVRSFLDNRTLLVAQFEAAMAHTRADFFDGKAAAIEKCLGVAAPFGRNASGPRSGVYADCMRAEMQGLRANATAERNATIQDFRTKAEANRADAKALFQSLSQAWLQANPRPS